MSKAKTLAGTVSTGGALENPSAIPAANISGAVGSATNLAGGSNGTIPYQSASGTTQMLAVGTAGQVLTSAGAAAPTWSAPAATGVTSVAATVPSIFSIAGSPITSTGTLAMTYSGTALPIANGGTGTTSTTFANLTTNVTGTLPTAIGGTGTTSTTFANLTTNVTGTLPIANGGTGTTSTTFANLTTNVTGTLPIANGGTNSTATATAGGAGYGTGTALAYTAAGTSGQLLQSNGASAPTWVTPSAGAMVAIGETTLSGSSTTISLDNSTYSSYFFLGYGISTTAAAANIDFYIRLNSVSSASYSSGGYATGNGTPLGYLSGTNTSETYYSPHKSGYNYCGVYTTITYGSTMMLRVFNIKSISQTANSQTAFMSTWQSSGGNSPSVGAGGFSGAGVTSITFSWSSGSTMTGKIRVYGIV